MNFTECDLHVNKADTKTNKQKKWAPTLHQALWSPKHEKFGVVGKPTCYTL